MGDEISKAIVEDGQNEDSMERPLARFTAQAAQFWVRQSPVTR